MNQKASLNIRSIDVATILDRLVVELRANVGLVVAAIVTLVGFNVALDTVTGTGDELYTPGVTFVSGIASLVGQYVVTRRSLMRLGLYRMNNPARFASMWGANWLSTLGILLGAILLIVPGLYLAARWFLASPVVLAEDINAGAGLRRSWELTKPSAWPILGSFVLIFVPMFVVGVGVSLYLEDIAPMLSLAIGYVAIMAPIVICWIAAVAIYALLVEESADLADVFA